MIVTVFRDIKNFIIYFFILLAFMAVKISLILTDVEGFDGIGSFKWFILALQSALLDGDIAGYESNTEYNILFWAVWFLIVLVGNIVLMNFIIAVVGDSYSNCMSKREAQTYKVKVDMIFERESIMSQDDLANPDYFPQYILVRKPVEVVTLDSKYVEQMQFMFKGTEQVSDKVLKIEEKLQNVDHTLQKLSQSFNQYLQETKANKSH